jgi:hypothetical protein
MKIIKYILATSLALVIFACSEDIMDDVNRDQNNTTAMDAKNLLPDIILKTAHETTGTDLAWYATVFIEHSAGTWAQSSDADKRTGQTASTYNNSWNNLFSVLTNCKIVLEKTDPITGNEPDNYWVRGVTQVLTAYNLAVVTDFWGKVPWTDAGLGLDNLKPAYENQSVIYGKIFDLLNDAVANLTKATLLSRDKDYIYGGLSDANNKAAWIKAANSLKVRYLVRLSGVQPAGLEQAKTLIASGFANNAEGFIFNKYSDALYKANPWWEFRYIRAHLSASQTLLGLMTERTDPRRPQYFTLVAGNYVGAPSGTALEVQSGVYSRSVFTAANSLFCMTQPTPLMTFYELKFLEAEAKQRTGDATYTTALASAIEASFISKGLTAPAAATYFTNVVTPRLAVNALNEILIQKYIAMYEAEAMEAYHDYRRTGVPAMNNPNNSTVGFINRLPYALSEESSNGANVPSVNIYTDKVWWAGGQE